MKYCHLFILLWLSSCTNNTSIQSKSTSDSASFSTTDTVPEVRLTVSKKPVATYLVSVNDPKLERTFGVAVFETSSTFKYLMRMHYEAIEKTDTLKIPNFGVWPEIKVIKGPDKISCVIGFLDKKKTFRPYKMLTAKGNTMKLILLKKYYTGRYSTRG